MSAKISDFVNGVHDAESSLKAGLDMEMMFIMHYTGFAISDKAADWGGDALTVTAKVKNTGGFDGAEVVQVYVGSKGAANGDDRPVKLLKGFQRVELKAGEEKAVTITIPNAELKFWTPDGWVLDGAYTVYVGTDSRSATAI